MILKARVHLRDARLAEEEGIAFPACRADTVPLDMSKTCLITTPKLEEVTCTICLKAYCVPMPKAKTAAKKGSYKRRKS